MFTNPNLANSETFPAVDEAALHDICTTLGAPIEEHNVLDSAAEYAIRNWLPETRDHDIPFGDVPYQELAESRILSDIGMADEITPDADAYSHTLLDGGTQYVYDYRLSYVEQLRERGVRLGEVIVFGGQRIRKPDDDSRGRLEDIALGIRGSLNSWGSAWIDTELAKNNHASPWEQSFATEHQVGILALLARYKDTLEHIQTEPRKEPLRISPDLPPTTTYFETFAVHDQLFKVLDSPAIIRRYLGVELPIANARPTGSSCFNDWESQLPQGGVSSALLVTHNPNTYRSWHDILLGWNRDPHKEISLSAAGAPIEQQQTQADMLGAFGRLVVSLKRAADRQRA